MLVVTAELEIPEEAVFESALEGEGRCVGHFELCFAIIALGPGPQPCGASVNLETVQGRHAAGQFEAVDLVFRGG